MKNEMIRWIDVPEYKTVSVRTLKNNNVVEQAKTKITYTKKPFKVNKQSAIEVAKYLVNDLQVGADGLPDEIVIRSRKASDDKITEAYDELFRSNFQLIPRIEYVGIQHLMGEELEEAILADKHTTERLDYFVYANIVLRLDGIVKTISIKLPYATPSGEIVLGGRHKRIINIIEDVIITSSPYKNMFKLSRSKITVERDAFRVNINGRNKTIQLLTSNNIFNRVAKGEPYKGKHPLGLVKLLTSGLYNIFSIPFEGTYHNGYKIQSVDKYDDMFYVYEHKGSLSSRIRFVKTKDIEMVDIEETIVDGTVRLKKVPKTKFEKKDSKGKVIKDEDGNVLYDEFDIYTVNKWSKGVKNIVKNASNEIPEFNFKYSIYIPKDLKDENLDLIKAILYLATIHPEKVEKFIELETDYKDGRQELVDVVRLMTLTTDKGIVPKIVNELIGAFYNNFDTRTYNSFKAIGLEIATFDDFYTEVNKNYLTWLGQGRLVGSRLSPMYSLIFPYASHVNNVFRNMSIGLNENDKIGKYIDIIARLQRDIGYGKPLAPLKNKPLLCLVEKLDIADFDVRGMWSFESQENGNGVFEQSKNGGVNTRNMPLVLQRKTPECLSYIDHVMLKKTSGIPLTLSPFIRLKDDIIQEILPVDPKHNNTFLNGMILVKTKYKKEE